MKKKILNYTYPLLNSLRAKMGAELRGKLPPHYSLNEQTFNKLSSKGVVITDDLLQEIEINDDGTLSWQGARIVIYIRDWSAYHESEETYPRFHIAGCSTYQKMKENGRKNRYVMATKKEGNYSHQFRVRKRQKEKDENLDICKNCLDMLQWNGYSSGKLNRLKNESIFQDFALSKFFEKYPVDIHADADKPTYYADNAPVNEYTDDFKKGKVQANLYKKRGKKCEECGATGITHIHHKNGLKYDNSDNNLIILCPPCHANQPYHGHMKANPKFKNIRPAPKS
ncbi:MAG: HNH endonuclease [Hydrotalea sp.]|nr:HNH endonuclease [Hydrotalea sp.]